MWLIDQLYIELGFSSILYLIWFISAEGYVQFDEVEINSNSESGDLELLPASPNFGIVHHMFSQIFKFFYYESTNI